MTVTTRALDAMDEMRKFKLNGFGSEGVRRAGQTMLERTLAGTPIEGDAP